MKLSMIHILKEKDYFQQHLKTNVEIIKMNFRKYQIKSKQVLKNDNWTGVAWTSGYDPLKGVRW